MKPLPLSQITDWAGAAPPAGDPVCSGVSTDTRSLRKGDLFIALAGEHFDGHNFVDTAAASGACAALVSHAFRGEVPVSFPLVRVNDPLAALQEIAGAYRASLDFRVICVTGSNGKTSTKDMVAAVLGSRHPVVKTEGNLNNHIGLPLSLLAADDSHRFGVFEIGMNHAGEIAPLAALAAPDAAIVTNTGTAHIEFLGTREAIAEEKAALPRALGGDGTAILPAGDDFLETLGRGVRARVITAGIGAGDIAASEPVATAGGMRFEIITREMRRPAALPVSGRHMVANATLAVAAGLEFGLSLDECLASLSRVELAGGRMETKDLKGIRFLDDTYNANPESMDAALRALVDMASGARTVAVLGHMGELGHYSDEGHARIGRLAGELGIDLLVTVGPEARRIASAAEGMKGSVHACGDSTGAADFLTAVLRPGDFVLFKGSRAAAMERVIRLLESKPAPPAL